MMRYFSWEELIEIMLNIMYLLCFYVLIFQIIARFSFILFI